MQYNREVLDRTTGELVVIDLGHWISVRELGEMHGLGRRQTTEVLRKLDVLQVEVTGRTVRHRLAPWFAERGFGKRLKRQADRFPFDVLSPAGQEWINSLWPLAVADIRQEKMAGPVSEAREALRAFSADRRPMTVQAQVCWLVDHHLDLTQKQMAEVLSISQQLVSRNIAIRAEQLARMVALKTAPVTELALALSS